MKICDLNEYAKHAADLVQQVKQAYDNNLTYPQIANKLNITLAQVERILSTYYRDRPRRQSPKSQEFVQKMKNLYDQGVTLPKMAAELGGITTQALERLLGHYYPDRQPRITRTPAEFIDQVKQLYDQGLSYKVIARKLGVSPVKVNKTLERWYSNRRRRYV
jgi:hypothetical protein